MSTAPAAQLQVTIPRTPQASATYNQSVESRIARLAQTALIALALCVGLGDIAQVSPPTTVVLDAVHALLPCAIGLAALCALRERRAPPVSRAIGLPLAAWVSLQLLSAVTASSYQHDALATLQRPVSGALLVCAVVVACRNHSNWLRLMKALALGGLGIAVICVAEASLYPQVSDWLAGLQDGSIPIGDVPRVAATLSHPNEAAMLLELSLPLLIAWAWTAHSRALLLAATGTLAAIVLTFSRAGIVTALVAVGLLGLMAARRGRPELAFRVGLVALALPLTLGWAALADPGLDHRLLASLDEASLTQPPRTQLWAVALQMAGDHPLLGVGPDNFRWLFGSYAASSADNLGIHAHNQYLEALADSGVLGFLALVWLLAALCAQCIQALRHAKADWPWRAALLASLSTWLLHALLDDFERFWPASVAFWLIAGLCVSQSSGPSAERPRT